jgi:hypothetical protein
MFVDDASLTVNDNDPQMSAEAIMEKTQNDISSWNKFLWILGGLLELTKTKYYMLIWQFTERGKPYLCPMENLPTNTVTVLDQEGQPATIERIPHDKGIRMLGVRKAGNLTESDEFKHLFEKTAKFTSSVIACPVKAHEIWEAYNTIYIPSVTYPLATTSLQFSQVEQLHKQLLPKLLPRMGYQHCFPRKIVFGPKFFGGMEVKDLECKQGTAKIQAILKHIRNDSAVGQTARILLRWAQIQAGTSKPILEDARDIPYIENDYILTLRHFMQQIKATLKEEDPWTVKTSRENDTHIMDEILDSPLIPATDYSTINYCRLYLQVTTIADITTSDGKRIRTEIMEGDRNDTRRDQSLDWPFQQKPGKTEWKKWKKYLQQTFCTSEEKLKQPLGNWIETDDTWNHRYAKDRQTIYTKTNGEWFKHDVKTIKRQYIIAYSNNREKTILPPETCPITDLEQGFDEQRFTTPAQTIKQRHSTIPLVQTFEQYKETLPSWVQQLISMTEEQVHDNELLLHELLQIQRSLNFVTDGGATEGHGYFGWVIATNSKILWRGKGKVLGNPHLMESLRTESVGMLSMTLFLLHYCKFHDIEVTNNNLCHYCDNSTVVGRMQWFQERDINTPNSHLSPDNDVQSQIEATMQELQTTFPSQWVKGHQEQKEGEELTWEAKLNIEADTLATEARNETSTDSNIFHQYPASKIMLYINGTPIT